jgi:hypothetical protein
MDAMARDATHLPKSESDNYVFGLWRHLASEKPAQELTCFQCQMQKCSTVIPATPPDAIPRS